MLHLLRLIANGLAPLTLLGAVVAYLEPAAFIWLKPWFQGLFAATMFALGVVLALKHFQPETALPGALFAVWCILTSAGAASYFRRSRHREALVTP